MYPSDELTLVAEVHGSAQPDERYVLSAHVQEPGANDNASGVGDLSEMARVLATLVRNGSVRPKRTITMLFGLEIAADAELSRRRLGPNARRALGLEPRHDRRGHEEDRWHVPDREDARSVGGLDARRRSPQRVGRQPDHERGDRAALLQRLSARPLSRSGGSDGMGRADESLRGRQRPHAVPHFKKPGALFWHFTDVYYHTDGDRIDKVSKSELVNVGNAALASVLTLTSADGATARALVAELERAAIARLDTELKLSKAALAAKRQSRDGRGHSRDVDRLLRRVAAHDDGHRGGRIVARDAERDRRGRESRQGGGRTAAGGAQAASVTDFCVWLAGHGSSCLELVAVVFGVVSVFLSVRQNIWSWPTALVNVALYFVLFFRSGLYSDMALQGVYFALSIYGWYEWLYGGEGRTDAHRIAHAAAHMGGDVDRSASRSGPWTERSRRACLAPWSRISTRLRRRRASSRNT